MKEEAKQVTQQLNWPGAVVLISGLIFVSGIISKFIEYKEKKLELTLGKSEKHEEKPKRGGIF